MKRSIALSELCVNCIIGILNYERENPQNLLIDVDIQYNFQKAVQTENIQETIDYTVLAKSVENLLIEKKYLLIETAAENLVDMIHQMWPMIQSCQICIKKPQAVPKAKYASVTVKKEFFP